MLNYLFSFHGRLGRIGYFMVGVTWMIIFIVYIMFVIVTGHVSINLLYLLIFAAWVSSFAVIVRRLHDMDLSGWVYPIINILPFLSYAPIWIPQKFNLDWSIDAPLALTLTVTAFVFIVILKLFYVMLLIWPARDKDNRFAH